MCGICGYVNNSIIFEDQVLQKMNKVMQHRGPDANGIVTFKDNTPFCSLGHVRLSIIDLAGGTQPMCNEDGTIWISYNGEVYNHKELRADLEARGHKYKTNSDTETLIHLYEEYGEDSPNYLRGMFAYAIWDDKKKKLFLVRDRLGIKPLYYTLTTRGIVFSSEIKAILESGLVSASLAQNQLAEYFSFGYLTGERTLFQGIKKLLPGHCILFDGQNTPTIRRYWNLQYKEQKGLTEAEVIETLKEMFFTSVKLRMMSDVPLGMFLSGGLDSSAIAGIMSRLSNQPLKAFTIGFEKQYYSESSYAKLVAAKNGMEMHEVILTPRGFVDSLEKLIWHNDMPIHFPASVALYFVSKKAKEHVKVVLTGEGSDELFGGYGRYMACHYNVLLGKLFDPFITRGMRNFIRKQLWQTPLPLKIRKAIAHSFLYHSLDPQNIIFDNYYKLTLAADNDNVINDDFIYAIPQENSYRNYLDYYNRFPASDTINRMLYTDTNTYLEELLMKQDKMSMATSIESRVPFLDHKLVEYAATLPSSMKVKFGSLKHVIKKAVSSFVPEEIVKRKKMGFPIPLATWMREPIFNTYMKDILLDSKTKSRGAFNDISVQIALDEHEKNIKDNSYKLWMLLNFELWCRNFLDRS